MITDILMGLMIFLGLVVGVLLVCACTAGALYYVRAVLAERRNTPMFPGAPNPAPTLGLGASVAVDEFLMMPMRLLGSMTPSGDYEKASAELDSAVRFYETNGWLDDPAGYFPIPEAPDDIRIRTLHSRRGPLEEIRFTSGYEPHPGEPGGERWRSFAANREVVARMLRHDGPPRPWLVCLHGQGMGWPADVDMLRLRQVHRKLGVNLLLPVAPLHGPRAEGKRSEQQFVSIVYPTNNVLGLAQCMWDLRGILTWLRKHEHAPRVGVFGFSLGSYTASLLSTLDADLACVIAVVPAGDLAEAMRAAEPLFASKKRGHRMVHDWRSALLHRVVSPLAKPCLVPRERRFIIAGHGDRIAQPPRVVQLWRHWQEPAIWWRPRGHLTTALSAQYDDYLADILQKSGIYTPEVQAISR